MRLKMTLVAIAAGLLLTTGFAAAQNEQQQKMKTCNAEASQKTLKGDARKTFMSSCLSGGSAAAAPVNAQQEKMKTCNADATAKKLKGADRKAFMKTCLSGGK